MNNKDVIYTAVKLDEESRNKLLNEAKKIKFILDNKTVICEHATLEYYGNNGCNLSIIPNLGNSYDMVIDKIIFDRHCVTGVTIGGLHVTIAIDKYVKPVYSNWLIDNHEDYQVEKVEVNIKGKVMAYMKSGVWIDK